MLNFPLYLHIALLQISQQVEPFSAVLHRNFRHVDRCYQMKRRKGLNEKVLQPLQF